MKKLLLLPLLVWMVSSVSAQKIVTEKGNLLDLKGESEFNLQYDFKTLSVGKYSDEQSYIDYKKGEYAKSDPKKAEDWEAGWKSAREKYYQPKFETQINKYIGGKASFAQANANAKYTLIVKTTFIEPGFNVGVMRQAAYIDVQYIFVESANPENVLVRLSQRKIPGADAFGYDFDASARISEAYAKAGKMLGGTLGKAFK
jgi:hypothetical protein